MKSILIFILISIMFTHCSIDRTILPLNNIESETLERFKSLALENQVQLSNENEPGQNLWLCLTFLSKESKAPLINQKIELYHASLIGEYEPSDPNDETTSRLKGSVITDAKGQIFVQTILPGDYGSSSDNRHIHTTVENAKPEAYDIHFNQYTSYLGKKFNSGSDQFFLGDLRQSKDSTLVIFLRMEVKRPQIQDEISN